MIKILSVVGARPNFIKISPVHKAFQKYKDTVVHKICHTGQHFDEKMSKVFFDELEMPRPDFYLGVSGGSHAEQTARIMIEFEKILLSEKPDMVIVPGDVNSTMAASIVASKLGTLIAHVEAGLRSFDRTMPEEINRLVTDALSDLLFITEDSGLQHLKHEGIDKKKIHFVGNVMIDSLVSYLPKIDQSGILAQLGIEAQKYILVTFHRPANVDDPIYLERLISLLNDFSVYGSVVFPVHPRTKNNFRENDLLDKFSDNVLLLDPIGYIDFLHLTKNSALVVTDSGGIQEETTFLGVQCITVRNNTERPVTVDTGTNHLIGTDLKKVKEAVASVMNGKVKKGNIPELWDGNAAGRIASIVVEYLG
jgi:UDP-N-acetylglucosamine 2-epimerase (non-hydrolysing)